MNSRLNIQDVAELLAERTGRGREEAERFLRLLVEAITDGVLQDQLVKVKGIGSFKLIEVEARESIHVHTGERFLIPAHYKFSFIPDKELREAVNRPFSAFETTEILNPVVAEGLEEEVAPLSSDPEKVNVEESVEELLPDREIPLPPTATKPDPQQTCLEIEPVKSDTSPHVPQVERRSAWAWLRYVIVALLLVVVACAFYFIGQNRAYKTLREAQTLRAEEKSPVSSMKEEPKGTLVVTEDSAVEVVQQQEMPKQEEPLKTVVIKRGDRLTNIALEHYGHKLFWVYIYQHNKALVDDPNNVPIGTELILPAPQQYGIDAKSRASLEAAARLQTEILTAK